MNLHDEIKAIVIAFVLVCMVVLVSMSSSGCSSASKKKAVAVATAATQRADEADKFIQKIATEGMTPDNQSEAVKQIQTYANSLRKCASAVVDIQHEVESEKKGAKGKYLKTLLTLIGVIGLNILYVIFRFRKMILSWAESAIPKL